jgi:hypothetical protein
MRRVMIRIFKRFATFEMFDDTRLWVALLFWSLRGRRWLVPYVGWNGKAFWRCD